MPDKGEDGHPDLWGFGDGKRRAINWWMRFIKPRLPLVPRTISRLGLASNTTPATMRPMFLILTDILRGRPQGLSGTESQPSARHVATLVVKPEKLKLVGRVHFFLYELGIKKMDRQIRKRRVRRFPSLPTVDHERRWARTQTLLVQVSGPKPGAKWPEQAEIGSNGR